MMQFSYTEGGPVPTAQTISIYCVNADDMTTPMDPLTVGLNDSASWLTLDKTSGDTPYEVHVSVNPAGLTPGTYSATIGISSTSEPITNATDTMPVDLTVVAAPPPPPPPTDTIPPTVTITKPLTGATFKGNSLSVTAKVADNVAIVKAELWVDGKLKGTQYEDPLPATSNVDWIAKVIGKGPHNIEVRVYDAAGNQANASITVTRI